VIGGGLAGLTVAREVAKRGWSVALIEANRIAGSASGRNTGFVLPGFGQSVHRLVERCGHDHAKALWALSEDGVAYVRNSILGLAMVGVDPVDGWLDVSTHHNADDLMPTLSLLGQDFGVVVEGWPVERVRDALKSNCYFHALHFPQAFSIHPVNYALGLAADAEQRGARLFEQTVALEVDPVGVRKRISTSSAKIRANQVVLAGNAEIGRLAPQLAATILPVTTYVAVTQPIPSLADAIAFRGAVSDSGSLDDQYRVVDADRVMWRSGATTWTGDARRHAANIKAAIERIYPQLRGVEIAQAWSGTMGVSVHGMPQIGEVAPGLWVANAFGGHGINTSAIAGVLIARAMIEHDDTWRLFLPYDLVWAGGALGRAVLQGTYWARRIRDKARARAAHDQGSNAGSPAAAATSDAPGP
jgi:glycine/D-amino acid oxidase-like deaminating enzyme